MFRTVILAGGGSKGISQLGAIQYMIDHENLLINNIHTYRATSVGAIISYLLIIGYSPIDILIYTIIHPISLCMAIQLNNIDRGLYDFTIIEEYLQNMSITKGFDNPTIQELYERTGVNFIITTTNLTHQKSEYLSHSTHPDVKIIQALRMSCNLPFIFGNYVYNGIEYIDGGILDNCPLASRLRSTPEGECAPPEVTRVPSDDVLCITFKQHRDTPITSIADKFYNILNLPIDTREREKIESFRTLSEYFIIEITSNIPSFRFNIDTNTRLELFSLGYNTAKEHVNEFLLIPHWLFE